jgi:DNA end-binding protein Ku
MAVMAHVVPSAAPGSIEAIMARAIWKGVIRFGDAEVPVKLYSAVEDRRVHFRLLHARDLVPVRQSLVNPQTDEEVPREEIRRGYPVPEGFVLLGDEELESIEPKASRTIEITRFVEPSRISHQWYDRPYWLGPDGSADAYFALAASLQKAERSGIARWTMRNLPYAGALQHSGDHLMLVTLRHAEEVVSARDLDAPGGRELAAGELRMAEQLLGVMEDDFDPSEYADEYRERILELVHVKQEGGEISRSRFRPRSTPKSLEHTLEESLRRARGDARRGGKERKSA